MTHTWKKILPVIFFFFKLYCSWGPPSGHGALSSCLVRLCLGPALCSKNDVETVKGKIQTQEDEPKDDAIFLLYEHERRLSVGPLFKEVNIYIIDIDT